jgi:Ca2+-binding EF-hand superfamily protein
MGNQQYQASRSESQFSQWETPRFQQISGISSSRLPQIHQEFIREAGTDGLINRSEFNRLYRELNLGSGDEVRIERAFPAFARDASGRLSFDEFLSASVMLPKNTNTRERITYLIDSNNPSGMNNTLITPDYGRNIISKMNEFYGTNADFDDIWSGLNATNGQVERDEFISYVSRAPTFVQYFQY